MNPARGHGNLHVNLPAVKLIKYTGTVVIYLYRTVCSQSNPAVLLFMNSMNSIG